VHTVLGVCPQFDTVWDALTVQQHLYLYARIKGVPRNREHIVVQQVGEAVGLDGDEWNQPAAQLSGGMKRRLSIGISMCGDPSIIFLDEPTTGLDPATRQGVWQVIEEAKQGRCLVLTTHSMEEADALCTRIGIMASGSLQCLGSQLHLKNKFGAGFQLSIELGSPATASTEEVDTFAMQLVAGTTLLDVEGARRTYNLPKAETNIGHVFKSMESSRHQLSISEWALSMTSLDDVFTRIVKHAEIDTQGEG